jgi:hypothetical protein
VVKGMLYSSPKENGIKKKYVEVTAILRLTGI